MINSPRNALLTIRHLSRFRVSGFGFVESGFEKLRLRVPRALDETPALLSTHPNRHPQGSGVRFQGGE